MGQNTASRAVLQEDIRLLVALTQVQWLNLRWPNMAIYPTLALKFQARK